MVSLVQQNIIAEDVSTEDYLAKYAADFCEWVDGVVIKMSPVSSEHSSITRFISNWLEGFLELNPIGILEEAPFVMHLERLREPDLMVVLNDHAERLTRTRVEGAADLVVEVVSEESTSRDYGDKFAEYEAGGVQEYWIIDPLRQEAHFYVLTSEGRYASRHPDTAGVYASAVLPGLKLPVKLLWSEKYPGPLAIGDLLRDLIK